MLSLIQALVSSPSKK